MKHHVKSSGKNRPVLFFLICIVFAAGGVCWFFYRNQSVKAINDLFVDDTLFADEIAFAAAKHGIPPELVRAVIRRESRFRQYTRGKAGEIGLMQILPGGAVSEWARVNKTRMLYPHELFNPKVNLDIGCWYLARALKRWQNYRCSVELALAEYNAGAKNAMRWKPDDPAGDLLPRIDFPGTEKYIIEIMEYYHKYLSEAEQKP